MRCRLFTVLAIGARCAGVAGMAAQMGAIYEPFGAAEAAPMPDPLSGRLGSGCGFCHTRYLPPTHGPYMRAAVDKRERFATGCPPQYVRRFRWRTDPVQRILEGDHVRYEPDIPLVFRVTGTPHPGGGFAATHGPYMRRSVSCVVDVAGRGLLSHPIHGAVGPPTQPEVVGARFRPPQGAEDRRHRTPIWPLRRNLSLVYAAPRGSGCRFCPKATS